MSSLARSFVRTDLDEDCVRRGRQAFRDGWEETECPFPQGSSTVPGKPSKRQSWLTGFFEEQVRSRVGHILAKYGVSWP